jgi:hypothetical protein
MHITIDPAKMTTAQRRWSRDYRGQCPRRRLRPGVRLLVVGPHGVGFGQVVDWDSRRGEHRYWLQPENGDWPARVWASADQVFADWWPQGKPPETIID